MKLKNGDNRRILGAIEKMKLKFWKMIEERLKKWNEKRKEKLNV